MSPLQQIIVAIVVAIIGSTAIANLIIFFVNRKDGKSNDLSEIKADVKAVKTEIEDIKNGQDEQKAATARIQILRFADELADGKDFIKGHYEDIYEAMRIYNAYCKKRPDFVNDLTVDSQALIRKRYQEHMDNSDFKKY